MARFTMRRRDLLRGLGAGTTLFAPFVRQTLALAAGKPTPNFLVFYTPNGHVRSAFGAVGSGAGFTLKPSLAPLEPWKAKLSVVSNLDNPGASSKASHEDCVRTLTCVPGSDIYRGYGPSIDWAVANHLGTRPMTMSSLWGQAPNWQSKISWKQDGVFDPHVEDAKKMYADIFANVTPTQNAEAAARLLAQRRSVLDFVRDDLTTLGARLAPADRAKLAQHADALRELEKAIGASASCSAATSSALEAKVDGGGGTLEKNLELKLDFFATAFACGVRSVGTILTQGASGGTNPLGGAGHHQVSHFQVANALEVWKKIDLWYAQRFAYLVKRLSDFGILDNTVVVWATEIAEGHSQSGFVMPVAGGSALGIQNGQSFSSKESLSNLWVSVQKAMGLPRETFGVKSSGGIPGLYKGV